ncbi:hypothetical protein BH11PSE1_BH11PSE1_00460 [soil metagenome]
MISKRQPAPAVSRVSAALRVKSPDRPAVRPPQAATPPMEMLDEMARSIRASETGLGPMENR